MFFEKTGPVWDTLRQLQKRFDEAGIDYVVIGGLALNAHNYARQTIDIDVVLTQDDCQRFEERLGVDIYSRVPGAARRFADPDSGVTIDLPAAGRSASFALWSSSSVSRQIVVDGERKSEPLVERSTS